MKILAIRFARLGDVLLLLPALQTLTESVPNATVVFLTGHRCAPIAQMCPFIDEVIAVDRIAMRDGPIWSALTQMASLVSTIAATNVAAAPVVGCSVTGKADRRGPMEMHPV